MSGNNIGRDSGLESEIKKALCDKLENKNIRLPGLMNFFKKGDRIVMQFNEEKSIGLGKGKLNMQDVNAAFEGWAVAIYAHYVEGSKDYDHIELDVAFDISDIKFDIKENGHYARFLYRILRFSEQYKDWFKLSEKLEEEKNKFKKYIEEAKCGKKPELTNNCPQNEGKEQNDKKDSDIEETLTEHKVEEAMIGDKKEELCKSLGINSTTQIYNQLPVGLFKGKVNSDKKFFTGGKSAIDMWAVEKDSFYMMELKFANKMIGIITEAFFYINFVKDLLSKNAVFELNQSETALRGYDVFRESKANINRFCAVMIADEIHPLVSDEVIIILNKNYTEDEKIEYKKIIYNKTIDISFN